MKEKGRVRIAKEGRRKEDERTGGRHNRIKERKKERWKKKDIEGRRKEGK